MSASNTRRRRRSALIKSVRAVNSSQARGQKQRIRVRRKEVGPAFTIVRRAPLTLRADTHVRYAEDVAERSVDRAAWADVVTQLIAQETGGNNTRFAGLVGVTYKTVRRWLTQETDVSEESVRQVARAIHVAPFELLMRVGYYTATDLAAPSALTQLDAGDDRALRLILEADVPPRVKQKMIQRLQQLRAQEADRQVDEVQWWVDQVKGA